MSTRTVLYVLLGVVAAAAAVLSFEALRGLALVCGFAGWTAPLLPAVVDARLAHRCRSSTRLGARGLARSVRSAVVVPAAEALVVSRARGSEQLRARVQPAQDGSFAVILRS